jgi:putative ABC transport system permease protein
MYVVALKMLLGDKGKYLGLVVGITFACFLMSQQVSIFIGLMARTASQILDVREGDIWVMDPRVQYLEEIEGMRDIELSRVRSVDGVAWASPLYKSLAVARTTDGIMQQVILMGIDDTSLVGMCPAMREGRSADILLPNALIMDRAGYEFMWPGEKVKLPRRLEINDRRVEVVGVCEAGAPFVTFPIVFTRYSEAIRYQGEARKRLSYIIVKGSEGTSSEGLAAKISAETGLQALTRKAFMWRSINYYLQRTGIPINFGITVMLGFIIGAAVAGQTFFIFVLENLRQFGALKALGVTNRQILGMVLLQALFVGAIGYGIGCGLTALFFEITSTQTALRGFWFPWQVMLGTGVCVILILLLASLASIRKVFVLDPAIVFRG